MFILGKYDFWVRFFKGKRYTQAPPHRWLLRAAVSMHALPPNRIVGWYACRNLIPYADTIALIANFKKNK
jgi:hypothetical protein